MGIFEKTLNIFKQEIKPDGQTIYFKNGKMYKIYPANSNDWYDAKYLVSDGKSYSLENSNSIRSIKTPHFELIDVMQGYGTTGSLDYVLRMKAGRLFARKEKELFSACLWKATELMFSNSFMGWRKDDYTRLIYWHIQAEMYEEAEKAKEYLIQKGIIFTKYELDEMKKREHDNVKEKSAPKNQLIKKESKKEKISNAEKELILVQRMTLNDMQEIKMPFICNTDIKKFVEDGGHPFAYMNILGENLIIVKEEIEKINKIINQSKKEYLQIPRNLKIDFNKLVFYSDKYGYTRIICNPKTYKGSLSKYPVTLMFMTDLSNFDNNTHGEITYGKIGEIEKAKICFWKNHKHTFLTYKNIDGILTISDIDSNM